MRLDVFQIQLVTGLDIVADALRHQAPENEWYRVEGTHEAIIDRTTFEAVQRGLRLRTRTDGTGEAHLLSGLVKCADCGSTMSKCSNGKRAYLRCKLYRLPTSRACGLSPLNLPAVGAVPGFQAPR